MDGYRAVWTDRERTRRVLVVSVAVALAQALVVVLFSVTVLPYALAVPLAVLLGPAAVWGVAIGAVFYELGAAGLGRYPVVVFADLLVCGVVGLTLWDARSNVWIRRPRLALVAIVPVALVATVVGAGVATVLAVALGTIGLTAVLVERLLLVAVLAPGLLAVGSRFVRLPRGRETPPRRWVVTLAAVALVAVGWLVGTLLFDLVRRDVQMFPALGDAIEGAVPPPTDQFVIAFGPWGSAVVLVGAVVALALIALVLRLGFSGPTGRR